MRTVLTSLTLLALLTSTSLAAAEVSDADKRIVQTIQRLSSFDYAKANPKTQEAINRYLDATAGSDEYFTLVEKYRIGTQAGTLLKITTDEAGTPKAGEAVKLLLKLGQQETVSKTLTPDLLKWEGVRATKELADSPNSKLIIMGNGKDGLPVILNSD